MAKKTKKEIVKTISSEIGLTQLKTKEIVQKTFDAIVDILVEEGRIELRKFGVFQVKKRAARKARNPRTGEKVDVGEKYVVTFKPGKEMEERVKALENRQESDVRESGENTSSSQLEKSGSLENLPGKPSSDSQEPQNPTHFGGLSSNSPTENDSTGYSTNDLPSS